MKTLIDCNNDFTSKSFLSIYNFIAFYFLLNSSYICNLYKIIYLLDFSDISFFYYKCFIYIYFSFRILTYDKILIYYVILIYVYIIFFFNCETVYVRPLQFYYRSKIFSYFFMFCYFI